MKMDDGTLEPWQGSYAKEILTQEILEGKVTESSKPDEVYMSNVEYQRFKKQNFKRNLKSLLKSLSNKEERAHFDAAAIAHDTALFPRPAVSFHGYPFWDTSDAKPLLSQDIDNNLDLTLGHEALWSSREDYQLFPEEVFCRHIHQERSKRNQSLYWSRKNKK